VSPRTFGSCSFPHLTTPLFFTPEKRFAFSLSGVKKHQLPGILCEIQLLILEIIDKKYKNMDNNILERLIPVIQSFHEGRDNPAIQCCTDGLRPVTFKLERIEINN